MKNTTLLYVAIFSTTFFACSKSKTEPESASITSVSQGLPVKSITHTFSATENHEHTNFVFNYSNNVLVSGTSQIRFTASGQILSEPSESFNLTRSATTISGNIDGQPFTGTLNTSGYLASLGDYTFSYTTDGYLKKIIETYTGGQSITEFTYSGGNLITIEEAITYMNSTDTSIATFQYGNSTNKSGVWPAPFDAGTGGYLSIFYYAALLGKPTKNLATSFNYQDSDENINETYTYTYTDGYISTCLRNESITENGTTRTTSDLVTYAYN